MRRVLYSLFAASLVAIGAGCCHTHGVCDCDIDDYCYTRQPYIHHGPIAAPLPGHPVVVGQPPLPGETIHSPKSTPLPPEKTREIPKELPPPVKGR